MQVIHLRNRHAILFEEHVRSIDFKYTMEYGKGGSTPSEFDFHHLTEQPMLNIVCGAIQQCFDSKLEFHRVQFHRTMAAKQIHNHVDSFYPNWDTLIIRLDKGDPRLEVNGETVREQPGRGYFIPRGTQHSVKKGKSDRYSLVAWCRFVL